MRTDGRFHAQQPLETSPARPRTRTQVAADGGGYTWSENSRDNQLTPWSNDPVTDRPFVLGLTGSIGMGKSAVAAMFAGLGVPVFDADAAVHELQGPGGALLPAIEAAFPGTTGPAGVDRAKLGAAVFGDPDRLRQLEGIVHPAVQALRSAFLAARAAAPLVVFDIPLLFEKTGTAPGCWRAWG